MCHDLPNIKHQVRLKEATVMFDDDAAWSAAEVYEAGWVQAVVIGDLAGRVKSIKNLIAQEMAQFAIRPFLMIAVRANEDDVFLAHTGSQQLVNDNAENTLPRGGRLGRVVMADGDCHAGFDQRLERRSTNRISDCLFHGPAWV